MNLVEMAKKIMMEAHAGQKRRDGITPYYTHPIAVRDIAFDWVFNSFISKKGKLNIKLYYIILSSFRWMENYSIDKTQFVELIEILSFNHDCPEDAGNKGFTVDYIIENLNYRIGYPANFFIVLRTALESVTHDNPKESYLDYILRVKQNPLGRIVKLADISHNISTLDRVKDKHKIDKYRMAEYILLN